MSGIGGQVNAEFKVDATKAAADLQLLVKRFSAVEKAVEAASKSLDTQGASTAAINAAHKELARQLERSTEAVKVSDKEWVKYAASLYTIHNVASLLSRSLMAVYDAAADGAKIQAAQQFFENAGKSIEAYREATNGMISDAELMKKANLADSMGISEETFKKLVMVAEASALKTGQSFEYMFNSIIVGTARSSRLLLDNLGIIVSVDIANRRYAESVGKAVDALSDEEKKLAFVNEVARQSKGTILEMQGANVTAAQSFAQLDAAASNFSDNLKKELADSMKESVQETTQFTKDMNTVLSGLFDSGVMSAMWDGLMSGLNLALGGLPKAIWSSIAEPVRDALHWVAQEIEDFNARLKGEDKLANYEVTKSYYDQILAAAGGSESGAEALIQKHLDEMAGSNEKLDEALAETIELFLAFNQKSKLYDLKVTGPSKYVTDPMVPLPNEDTAKWGQGGRPKKPEKDTQAKTWSDYLNEATRQDNVQLKHMETVFEQTRRLLNPAFSGGSTRTAASTKHDGSVKAEIDFAQKMNDFFVQPFKEAFESMQAPMASALRGLVSTLIQGAAGIANALMGQSGLMAAIGQLAGGILEGVGSMAQTLVALAGDALAPLTFGISAIVAKPLNAMMSVFTEGGAAALSAFGQFGDTMAPIIELMKYVGDVLYGVKNALGNSFEAAAFAMRDSVTLLGRTFMYLAEMGVIKGLADMFAQLLGSVVNIFTGMSLLREAFGFILNVLTPLGGMFNFVMGALKFFGDFLMGLNDFIVVMARDVFGQGGWGKLSSELRVEFDPAPIEGNTEAVRENTAALRDFAREFRNLPAGFKAEGYIFDTQSGVRLNNGLGSATFLPGMGTNNQRPRT